MSKQIPKRVLRPSKVIEAIKKRWISDKPTAADRNYSTAVAVIPEIYEENVYEDKNELIESVPKEYSEIPGPKEWPLVGNAWRFAPLIGKTIYVDIFVQCIMYFERIYTYIKKTI